MGAAFGAALSAGVELEAASKRLASETGLTGQAAKDAEKSLAAMYGNNLQGFDAIAAAMTKVNNDLGLTGEAADAATQKFLTYQRATNQASDSVAAYDDILDAWNLTAADAGTIMDKLIVSHQKYGGVVADSERALSAMAPAMQAANMTVDDGIALLNLFNAAGIDASKAPAALAKAVNQLKPGQGLDDLIAQIGAIEDPTQRGQAAMRIFGARSGIGMAQAIKPGMKSLADLAASLGDTAGAADRAAEASLSWGDRASLAFKKVGGALAEFGQNFGPLLMAASALGPKLAVALSSAIGVAIATLGPIALPVTAVVSLILAANWLADQKSTEQKVIDATNAASQAAFRAWRDNRKHSWDLPLPTPGEVRAQFAALAAETTVQGTAAGVKTGVAWTAGFAAQRSAANAAGRLIAASAAQGTVQGTAAARSTVDQAWTDMLAGLKHQLSPAAEQAQIIGRLTSGKLIEALHSKDPAVREAAEKTKTTLTDRLDEIVPESGKMGANATALLAKRLRSKDKDVSGAAAGVAGLVKSPLAKLPGSAAAWGRDTALNLASGLASAYRAVAIEAARIAAAVAAAFEPGSPTKAGPLSLSGGMEAWGARLAGQFADGLATGAYRISQSSSMLAGTLATGAGFASQAAPIMASGGGIGGATTTININAPTVPMTPRDIGLQLRRVAALGVGS
jgi:hypothetical protein